MCEIRDPFHKFGYRCEVLSCMLEGVCFRHCAKTSEQANKQKILFLDYTITDDDALRNDQSIQDELWGERWAIGLHMVYVPRSRP